MKTQITVTLVVALLALSGPHAAAAPLGWKSASLRGKLEAMRSSLHFLRQDLQARWRHLRHRGRNERPEVARERRIGQAARLGWDAGAVRALQSSAQTMLSIGTRVRGPQLKETVRLEMDPLTGRLSQPPRLAGKIMDAILDGRRVRITSPYFKPYEITTLEGLKRWADTVRTETPKLREAERLRNPRPSSPNNRWRPDRWTQWTIPRPRGTVRSDGEGLITRAGGSTF